MLHYVNTTPAKRVGGPLALIRLAQIALHYEAWHGNQYASHANKWKNADEPRDTCCAGKLSQAEIARQLGVSRMTVSDWTKQLQAGGLRALRRVLRRGALAAGFPTESWTMGRVHQVIEREFDVHYHPNSISRVGESGLELATAAAARPGAG